MGILIRSAQLTHDPVVLPLFSEHRVAPTHVMPPPSHIVHQPDAIAHKPPHTDQADPALPGINPPQLLDSHEADEAPPPDLDPELKQALLAEMKSAYEVAVKEGFETGYAEGLAKSKQLLQEQIDSITKLLSSASEVLQSQIVGLEDIVVALGFETVCKIIGDSQQDCDSVIAIVRQVISHVKECEPITIRVSPSDFHLLSENKAAITQAQFSSAITLMPDDRVLLGGCLIETSGGSLDGRLETQLQQVKDALLSARRQRSDWKETPHAV